MEYFVYGIDRPGSGPLRDDLIEEHWSYMDRYASAMIARGPTLTGERDAATGSIHVVDLPDDAAARAFAFDEPNQRAGVYAEVRVFRFTNTLARTMWDFTGAVDGYARFLVLSTDAHAPLPAVSEHMLVYGRLRALGDDTPLSSVAVLEAPSRAAAAAVLPSGEAHPWQMGGRR